MLDPLAYPVGLSGQQIDSATAVEPSQFQPTWALALTESLKS